MATERFYLTACSSIKGHAKLTQPLTLEEWSENLTTMSETDKSKNQLPCFLFGRLEPETQRRDENVLSITALCLDIERKSAAFVHKSPQEYEARVEKALQRLEPYHYFLHTTFSHTEEDPRFRVVLPLEKAIEGEHIKRDYKRAMSYLNNLTGSIADPAAQKLSQPSFAPLVPLGTIDQHFALTNKGTLLDVSTELAKEVATIRSAIGEGVGKSSRDAFSRQVCEKLLKGQPYADEGSRDNTALLIARRICNGVPHPSIEAVEELFHWSTEAMGNDAPTAENILDKIERGTEKFATDAPKQFELTDEEIKERENNPDWPYAVQFRGNYYFRKPQGGFSRVCTREDAEIAARKYLRGFDEVCLTYTDGNGHQKQLPVKQVVMQYGDIADDVIVDLRVNDSFFKGGTFHEATICRPHIEPTYHPEIAKWLELLAGPRAEDLNDWLSLFTNLDRLLSTLVLMGEPKSGKTLLAMGLARMFGVNSPASQETITGRFQGELSRCPFVYIDEEITNFSYQKSFLAAIRNQLSTHERMIERKYLEPMQMTGAIRCLISANHMPFKSQESNTKQDLDAIAERFFLLNATKAPVEFLESVDPDEKQTWASHKIAQHATWLQQNREVDHTHRFGVPGDSERFANLINIGSKWNSLVTEWVCNGVLDRFRQFKNSGKPGLENSAVIDKGSVYVRAKAITEAWDVYQKNTDKKADTQNISNALRGINEEYGRPKELGLLDLDNRQHYFKIRYTSLVTWVEEMGVASEDELREALNLGDKVIDLEKAREGKEQ